jgi:hypothetical protein
MEYYIKAVDVICSKVSKPVVYVFSDDMDWAKKNLKCWEGAVFVDSKISNSAHEDHYLMSQCDHHIIANSSFSWWAAWLNPSRAKIVIAPKQWFANNQIRSDDLIPSGWITI